MAPSRRRPHAHQRTSTKRDKYEMITFHPSLHQLVAAAPAAAAAAGRRNKMNSMHDCVYDGDSLRRPTLAGKAPNSGPPEGEDLFERADRKGQVNRRRVCPCTGRDSALTGAAEPSAGAPWAAAELFGEEDEMLSWLDYALGDGDGGNLDGGYGPCGHFPESERNAPPPPPLSGVSYGMGSTMTRGQPGTGRVPATSSGGGKVGVGTSWSSGIFGDGGAGGKDAPFSDITPEARGADYSDDDDSNGEDGEQEGRDKDESRRSTSRKKPRTAEVHNLSERRRRNRINEKMKALQQLIPRCNKSSKASVLDDAIEYLKSLQIQLQMMSAAACGMAPVVCVPPPTGTAVVGVGVGSRSRSFHQAVLPFLPVLPTCSLLPAGAPPFRALGPTVLSDRTTPRADSQQGSAPSRRRACSAAPTTTPAANHADPRRRPRRSRTHAQSRAAAGAAADGEDHQTRRNIAATAGASNSPSCSDRRSTGFRKIASAAETPPAA